jgi:hypothetical protein
MGVTFIDIAGFHDILNSVTSVREPADRLQFAGASIIMVYPANKKR